ncbi:UDP-N-acetylmuramate--L-alanine ligase [Miniphocaeibacter halophilus]|uniref:UDP-N-acetylmuramate--L-alanine ligase n=1 Tax=Miniphocaeibacter halophilus TaxID=2931922 RepID=A0AC61MSL0_9FIRM|nr:UDP-N-acetylmuramate--L-alanine ligase [Miniphocaeibacter halophilus]QQK08602.1 UDP-N-acetylmuramate--L-alanine ligase [Miniphocaeibacter halophilus]
MFNFNLYDKNIKKVHFIGIGGVSMSGIAELLKFHNFDVSGSDRDDSDTLDHLRGLGIKISIGQKKENINNPDLIIYTDAILPDNEELIAAKNAGVPCVSRGVFLGALMRNYKYSIGVSGSHGKSTTTSMISKILVNSEVDPNILLGGKLDEIDGNVHCGKSDYLLTEACEFKANILNYYPSMAIILNIDEDHLDFYKDINHIVSTFIGYMKNLDENSKAVINIDDENCLPLLDHIKGEVLSFGIENEKAVYNIKNISFDEIGHPSFDIVSEKEGFGTQHFSLNIIGRYNIYNSAAAIIASFESGIDLETIKESMYEYKNLHRRMEVIGKYKDAIIMTDYGHHPVEIKATMSALAEHKKEKLVCVFQPHTYSRTKHLLNDFANSFYDCDEVIVTEIYAAREKFDPTIHSVDLVEKLRENGVNAIYLKTFEEAKDHIQNEVKNQDVVITTGCGNPDVLAKMIVE